MIKKLILSFITIALVTMVGACSSNYVSTNLNKDNINQYFSASKVTIYSNEQLMPLKYHYISLVEGQDCQIEPHHAIPDEINARTQARQQAFNINANGIVFTGCATLDHKQLEKLHNSNDTKECHAIIICYAKAYVVDEASP